MAFVPSKDTNLGGSKNPRFELPDLVVRTSGTVGRILEPVRGRKHQKGTAADSFRRTLRKGEIVAEG